jgi:hypothetical protein
MWSLTICLFLLAATCFAVGAVLYKLEQLGREVLRASESREAANQPTEKSKLH